MHAVVGGIDRCGSDEPAVDSDALFRESSSL
jgi:hypothetical protein